ncbi:MAG: hypothetical protein ACRC2T_03340 [Thermoguttaceae bacterium]
MTNRELEGKFSRRPTGGGTLHAKRNASTAGRGRRNTSREA